MTVAAPPRPPSAPSSAPVDAQALEALIEEARRRARRRRQAYGLAALLAAGLGGAAFFGFGGRGGDAGAVAHPRQPIPGVSGRTQVSATNGELTILGGEGIATVSPAGGVRSILWCARFGWRMWPDSTPCSGYAFSVDWAPDGRRLAYATAIKRGAVASERRDIALHVRDTATGREIRRRVVCFASDIDWVSDGSRLAFACDGKISIIEASLSRPPRLLSTIPGSYSSPTWSPDGNWIAFAKSAEGGKRSHTAPGIYLLPARSGSEGRPVFLAHGWSPAWSPDGTRIAFQTGCGRIKLVTPSGADVTPASLVRSCRASGVGGVPVWSPAGAQLAIA
jgi:WD40-like Beta Propeller Repeat